MGQIDVIDLGRTGYKACWELQQRLFDMRLANHMGDLLLLTEHDHVYTIGKTGDDSHLLADERELELEGIPVFHNDRGGNITYHGPGQVVGYPILDLNNFRCDLHLYLRDLEEVIIRTLARYDIACTRDPKFTGVWVGKKKICAIGIKTRQWVTMHGFALNVCTDLSFFERIVPCGISGRGVTSLQEQIGAGPEMREVVSTLINEFGAVFNTLMNIVPAGETFDRMKAA